ncbi:8708_t:CDS:2, partial [Racocetra fulgida]
SHPEETSFESVSANNISPETKISSTPQVSIQTHDRAYFRNKILDRYSDIYKEFSSEKFDYYGIIDKSLCPACKSSHRDEKSIRGRYEAGSYFIKCGQQEIEITATGGDNAEQASLNQDQESDTECSTSEKIPEDLSILCKKRSEETDDFPTPETSERIINAPSALESTEVSELIAPIPIIHGSNSLGNSSFTPQIAPAESEKGTNEVQIVDDSDCSHDNDSEEERLDESDDDRYNGYDRYDEYGGCDRGYYYRDGEYKRKSSPMMSPIISPVTA